MPPSSRETEETREREKRRLADPDYAVDKKYISEEELSNLRNSYVAISELSFGFVVLGAAGIICLGIAGWMTWILVGMLAALVVFGFMLLSIERFHKFRSSFKTLVLERYQARADGEEALPGGTA